jgi:hypothetical protein
VSLDHHDARWRVGSDHGVEAHEAVRIEQLHGLPVLNAPRRCSTGCSRTQGPPSRRRSAATPIKLE